MSTRSDQPHAAAAAIQNLSAWVSAALELARTADRDPLQRAALVRHFESLPSVQVFQLASTIDPSNPDIISLPIEESRRRLAAEGENGVVDIYRELSACQGRLRVRGNRNRVKAVAASVLKIAMYVGPLVGAYLLVTYFRFYNNVYFDSAVITHPLSAHESASDDFNLTEDYRRDFFHEFSRFYFARQNSFMERFVESSSEDVSSVNLRTVFRNPRGGEHLLIAAVDIEAALKPAPFEWAQVDASASVDIEASSHRVLFSQGGVGPAVDLSFKIDSEGLDLATGRFEQLFESVEIELDGSPDNRPVAVRARGQRARGLNPDVLVLPTVDSASPYLRRPVFWLVTREARAARQPQPDGLSFVSCGDGRVFERIETVKRLSELSKVVRGGTAAVAVTYGSLRGDRVSKGAKIELALDRVYVLSSQNLSQADDPCRQPVYPAPAPAPPAAARPPALLDRVAGPVPPLEGVDLIKTSITVDFRGATGQVPVRKIVQPDQILNPGGFLLLDIAVRNAVNGQVVLTLRVNGSELHRLRVQTLVPEQLRYSYDLARELRRFGAPGESSSDVPSLDESGRLPAEDGRVRTIVQPAKPSFAPVLAPAPDSLTDVPPPRFELPEPAERRP